MTPTSKRGIDYYSEEADTFHNSVRGRMATADAVWIVENIPKGGVVVDAGCGTGEDVAYFVRSGIDVYAYDASLEMVSRTRATIGPNAENRALVQCHDHLGLRLPRRADAILASASLLFLEPIDLADALRHLGEQLKPGGFLLASFKRGHGARKQTDGRSYFDREPEDLTVLSAIAGLEAVEARCAADLLGRHQRWVTFVLKR